MTPRLIVESYEHHTIDVVDAVGTRRDLPNKASIGVQASSHMFAMNVGHTPPHPGLTSFLSKRLPSAGQPLSSAAVESSRGGYAQSGGRSQASYYW